MIVHRLRLTVLKRLASTRNCCMSCSNQKGFTVTVIGAAGGIGQPLSLLLKQHPMISKLNLYDIAKVVPGVGVDLSHINTPTKVTSYGKERLTESLNGANIVVIPAGLPRKPGMTRDDLFKSNADLAYRMGTAIADNCPCALVAIITNPVNSTVPILAEAMFKKNRFDPKKIFGVTTLDLVRAETFCAEINGCNPCYQKCPVIGGHAGATIIPLLSQANPPLSNLSDDARVKLTKRIQEAGTEVVKAKDGGGSATLSMAYAAARFTNSLLKALSGDTVVEYAYIRSNVTPVCYFSCPVVLGIYGIRYILSYGYINEIETRLFSAALPQIEQSISRGMKYAASKECRKNVMNLK